MATSRVSRCTMPVEKMVVTACRHRRQESRRASASTAIFHVGRRVARERYHRLVYARFGATLVGTGAGVERKLGRRPSPRRTLSGLLRPRVAPQMVSPADAVFHLARPQARPRHPQPCSLRSSAARYRLAALSPHEPRTLLARTARASQGSRTRGRRDSESSSLGRRSGPTPLALVLSDVNELP